MKILIVDDSKAMRGIVKRTLGNAGFGEHETLEAGSADEAEKLIRSGEPDIVLLDINMPKVSGLDLVRTLHDSGVEFAFGICSAERNPQVLQEARELGARFVLTKPFKPDDIHTALTSAMPELVTGQLQETVSELRRENEQLRSRLDEDETD